MGIGCGVAPGVTMAGASVVVDESERALMASGAGVTWTCGD